MTDTTMSNPTKGIYHKLLKFQQLGLSVKKDGKNPHFKSNYPTLNEVLDKVTEPLNAMGILIIFTPELEGLRTVLLDTESGETVESFMKYVGVTDAQKLLACNTYYRRGSLIALLGLSDEDDDGNKATQPTHKAQTKTAPARPAAPATPTQAPQPPQTSQVPMPTPQKTDDRIGQICQIHNTPIKNGKFGLWCGTRNEDGKWCVGITQSQEDLPVIDLSEGSWSDVEQVIQDTPF